VAMMCEALGVSRSGSHAWLTGPGARAALADELLVARLSSPYFTSDRNVWRPACGARCRQELWAAATFEGVVEV
jgi:putative transposase